MTRFVNVRTSGKKERKEGRKEIKKEGRKEGREEKEIKIEREREMAGGREKEADIFFPSETIRPGPEEFSRSLTRRYSAFVNFQDEYSRNI